MSGTKIETTTDTTATEGTLTEANLTPESVTTEKPETEATLTPDAFVALVVGLVASATPTTEGTLAFDQEAVNSAYRTVAKADRTSARKALTSAIRDKFASLSVTDEHGMALVRGLMEAEGNLTAKAPAATVTPTDPRPGMIQAWANLKAAEAALSEQVGPMTDDEAATVADVEAVEKLTKAALPKASHTFTGERGSIQSVIDAAFDGKASGTFLKVSEIVHLGGSVYGDRPVSSGAVEARLFPKNGKVTLTGVTPVDATDDHPRGAMKV